jgi:uncharacterized protein YbjT (DUF2867 family)
VGGEVVRALLARGVRVRALARDATKAAPLAALGAEVAVGDLADPDSLARALAGVERAFLASALDPRQVELQGNFVEAARRARLALVVKLSGLGTAPESPLASGRWHARTERDLERSGVPWTFLRPPYFLQNALRMAPVVAATRTLPNPLGCARVAGVDVRDVAAVAVAALSTDAHAGKAYAVTGPEALTFSEMADAISAAIGRPVTCVAVSPRASRERMLAAGMPEWHAEALTEFSAYLGAGGGAEVADTVGRLTGRPARRFAALAREHAALFRGRG